MIFIAEYGRILFLRILSSTTDGLSKKSPKNRSQFCLKRYFTRVLYFTSHSHSYCQQGENKTVTDHISNYGEIIIAERNLMSYRKAVLFQYICTPATVAYVKKTFVI